MRVGIAAGRRRASLSISSDDPEIVARGARLLDDALAVARDLGSPYLCGVIAAALGKYDRPPTALGWDHCRTSLRNLAERAATSGITLGIEVVNRYDSNLINTAEQALRMIDEIGHAAQSGRFDSS